VISGAILIKLLRTISNLSENFKCVFSINFQIYLNETFHAYEKTMFFISMKSFIGVLRVKIKKSAIENFT